LTGLRWAAALFVFVDHLLGQFFVNTVDLPQGPQRLVWSLFFSSGAVGVTFFFVLSGFVLMWSRRQTDAAPAFWRRRFFKIYPNHVLTMGGAILIALATGTPITFLQFASHLTLTQSWTLDTSVANALNAPSWSLSCEAFFYLCFPLMAAKIELLSIRRMWQFVIGIPAAIIALNAAFIPASATIQQAVVYVFPPIRMLEFAFGMLLAALVRAGAWRGPGLGGSLLIFVLVYLFQTKLPAPLHNGAVTVAPIGLMIVAAALADATGRKTIWSGRTMVWLGEVSFAFYQIHLLVFRSVVAMHLRPAVVSLTWLVVATAVVFAVSLLLSAATLEWFEKPIMKRFARASRPRHRTLTIQSVEVPSERVPMEPFAAQYREMVEQASDSLRDEG
jgi:peptidoglycan/LPS O-acetylase OafA/YrhL